MATFEGKRRVVTIVHVISQSALDLMHPISDQRRLSPDLSPETRKDTR